MKPQHLSTILLLVALAAPGCGGDDAGALDDAGVTSPDAEALPDLGPPSDGPPREGGALYGDQPFSIVLLPDTQFYAQSYPEMFVAEAAWIAEQKEAMKWPSCSTWGTSSRRPPSSRSGPAPTTP
jgi:hypothetical protein